MYVTHAESGHESGHGYARFAPRCGIPHRFWTDFPGPGVVCHEPNTWEHILNSRGHAETLARLTVAASLVATTGWKTETACSAARVFASFDETQQRFLATSKVDPRLTRLATGKRTFRDPFQDPVLVIFSSKVNKNVADPITVSAACKWTQSECSRM